MWGIKYVFHTWSGHLIELMMRYNMFSLQILISTHYFHLATSTYSHTKSVCLRSWLEGDWAWHLCSATRDVHLFNSIIGVYQLSYLSVHCMGGGKSQVGMCTCTERELDTANPSPRRRHHSLVCLEAPGRLPRSSALTLAFMKVYSWQEVCYCTSRSDSITHICFPHEFAYFLKLIIHCVPSPCLHRLIMKP